jgi:hypothetical protein
LGKEWQLWDKERAEPEGEKHYMEIFRIK